MMLCSVQILNICQLKHTLIINSNLVMNNLPVILLVFTLLTGCSLCFSIEGNWKVTHVHSQKLQHHQIIVSVEDYIFRNTTVRWTFSFQGCYQFKYQVQVEEDNLFINTESFYLNTSNFNDCEDENIEYQRALLEAMKKCFKFQIISNYMFFSDLTGEVLIKFERFSETPVIDLRGVWLISKVNSMRTSQLLIATNKTFEICQGKATFEYEVVSKYKIQIVDIQDRGCESQQFVQAFQKIKYFRIRGKTLNFYSKSVNNIISSRFYQDLELYQSEMEEVQRKQEELAKERVRLEELERQRILKKREEEEKERLKKLNEEKQKQSLVPQLKNSKADLVGKWTITNIFGIPVPVQNIDFIITDKQIILAGCNTHIVNYIVDKNEIIETGQIRSTKKICSNDQDGLYKRGLEKVHSYKAALDGKQIVVQMFDKNGKLVYELRRQATLVQSTPQRSPTPPPPTIKPPPILRKEPAIFPGKYMILLLGRRDLPRKLARIEQNRISFKICNNIEFSFNLEESENRIHFSLEERSGASSSCNLNREDPYVQFFLQIAKYEREEIDIMLSNQEGKQIINLDMIG